MSVEKLVKGVIDMQWTDLIDRVYADFKAEVGKHNRSGQAQASISIMSRTPSYALIGGNDLHLYYLDKGNGGKGRTIYPKRARGLYLKDYGVWTGSVSGYDGFHVARKVANKYR